MGRSFRFRIGSCFQGLSLLYGFIAYVKGFAVAWCYFIGYALDLADKAIAFSIYMLRWFPDVPSAVWVSIFILLPLAFNLLNVRRYGEIEFTLTAIKIMAILGLIILGFLIAIGGTGTTQLLATNNADQPIPCGNNQTGCLSAPGFKCKTPHKLNPCS